MRVDLKRGTANTNPVAGGGLSGNRDVRRTYADTVFQMDRSGNVEHNNARTDGVARFTQRAGTSIIETRHDEESTRYAIQLLL